MRHLQPHRTSPAELTGASYIMTWINENLHRHAKRSEGYQVLRFSSNLRMSTCPMTHFGLFYSTLICPYHKRFHLPGSPKGSQSSPGGSHHTKPGATTPPKKGFAEHLIKVTSDGFSAWLHACKQHKNGHNGVMLVTL